MNQNELTDLINMTDKPTASKQKYIRDIQYIFDLSNIEKLDGSIETFETIKQSISTAFMMKYEDEHYSINSQKGMVQAVLFCFTISKIPLTDAVKIKYDDLFSVYKMKSIDENTEKQINKVVLTYDEYINKVLTQYSKTSKQYLIVMMYKEITARDNFGTLKIITSHTENTDPKQNYIVNPKTRGSNINIIIQDYKTKGIYGIQDIQTSDELTELLRKYIKKNKLAEYLFPKNLKYGLCDAVYELNKKIGVDGSINAIRHMVVSDALNDPNITPEARLLLSKSMMHSPIIQSRYRNNQIEMFRD